MGVMVKFLFVILFVLMSTGVSSQDSVYIHNSLDSQVQLSVEYLHDDSELLSIDDVVHLDYVRISNKECFSPRDRVAWYRVTMTNSFDSPVSLVLHNNKGYLSKQIELYDLMVVNRIEVFDYDLFEADIGRKFAGSTLIYPVTIPPESSRVLYIKNESIVHQCIDLAIHDEYTSAQALINKNLYSNILIVLLFGIAAYNLLLCFFIGRKEFFYYSVYLFNAAIGLSYMYGTVFHNLELYGEKAYWLNVTAILVSPFLVLFVQAVFDTKKTHVNLHKLLNSVLILSIVNFLISVLWDLGLAIQLVPVTFSYSFAVLIYMALKLYKEKDPLILVFSFAYGVYITGIAIVLLMFTGYVPLNDYTFHASGLGIFVEALLFSYLIHHRISLLKERVEFLTDKQVLLQKIANIDELTGVLNRRAYNEQVNVMFEVGQRRNDEFSLLMLDLDFFKNVNDQYGHQVGDVVLVQCARKISSIIREHDLLYRVGGEEFYILLPNTIKDEAMNVAEKIREALEKQEVHSGDIHFRQTVSIGVAGLSTKDKSILDLQERADKALYAAKSLGRNTVVFE